MTSRPWSDTLSGSYINEVAVTHVAESNIVKIDEDQQLVFGWASVIADEAGQTILDRQTDFIDSPDELEKSAYDYVLHSRDGGEMHVRKGVATMVESMVFTQEKQDALGVPRGTMPVGWWLGFKVNDDDVWAEVKKQEYMGFSVHGKGKREKVDIDLNEFNHEQPLRKMHGEEWPAEAFAFVPDPTKPSTWRIRTWETVEKGLTPRSVSRAIAAWSRSELGNSTMAKAGLSKAWSEIHPGVPLPKEIETVTDFDRKRILLKARTAMALSKHAAHDQKAHGSWAGGGGGGAGGGDPKSINNRRARARGGLYQNKDKDGKDKDFVSGLAMRRTKEARAAKDKKSGKPIDAHARDIDRIHRAYAEGSTKVSDVKQNSRTGDGSARVGRGELLFDVARTRKTMPTAHVQRAAELIASKDPKAFSGKKRPMVYDDGGWTSDLDSRNAPHGVFPWWTKGKPTNETQKPKGKTGRYVGGAFG